MKKKLIVLFLSMLSMGSGIFAPRGLQAAVEWTVLRSIDLKVAPLDVAPSPDGQWLFILIPGEIQRYSLREEKVIDHIPVDGGFDRITSLPIPNGLAISSSRGKTIQIVMLQPVYEVDVSGLPFKGPGDAPVTIAVFDDYQCPYCAGLEPLLRRVLEKYPKQVKFVMVNFPLSMHQYARKAAVAALAASREGKFWEMHDKLFENQKDLSDAKIDAIAKELGLDMQRFGRDLQDPAIASLIDRDLESGRQANVEGTPAIFINGKELMQRSLRAFQEAIEAELRKVK